MWSIVELYKKSLNVHFITMLEMQIILENTIQYSSLSFPLSLSLSLC